MIKKCNYAVDCDNDCGCKTLTVNRKSDIKRRWIVYKFERINPIADDKFILENGDIYDELHFCCQRCADEFFDYYKSYKEHYKKIN